MINISQTAIAGRHLPLISFYMFGAHTQSDMTVLVCFLKHHSECCSLKWTNHVLYCHS